MRNRGFSVNGYSGKTILIGLAIFSVILFIAKSHFDNKAIINTLVSEIQRISPEHDVTVDNAARLLSVVVKELKTNISELIEVIHDISESQQIPTPTPMTPVVEIPKLNSLTQINCNSYPQQAHCKENCNWDSDTWNANGVDLCVFMNLANKNIFGSKFGIHMATANNGGMFALSHADFLFLDYIITTYPLINMTELGTAAGISSIYFGMAMKMRGGTFHTFDYREIRDTRAIANWLPNMQFFQEDILTTENQKVVQSLTRGGPLHGFFDNGNKKQEVNVYAKYLPVGSILTTHDWDVEINIDHIKETLAKYNFVQVHEKLALNLKSHVRAWIRK